MLLLSIYDYTLGPFIDTCHDFCHLASASLRCGIRASRKMLAAALQPWNIYVIACCRPGWSTDNTLPSWRAPAARYATICSYHPTRGQGLQRQQRADSLATTHWGFNLLESLGYDYDWRPATKVYGHRMFARVSDQRRIDALNNIWTVCYRAGAPIQTILKVVEWPWGKVVIY